MVTLIFDTVSRLVAVYMDMASGATRTPEFGGPNIALVGHVGALRSGRGGRRFKSCHSDQTKPKT